MRPVTWLQISDFHLQDSQAWAQDIVLAALGNDIARRRERAGTIDFVLATGDLAFAGKTSEYIRAAAFFDDVAKIAGIPRDRIYCVPGNHDVDRSRQKMSFAGARHVLQSQNEIDQFLGSPEEVATLLQRQENYYQFQETYFADQLRTWTTDRLGYVSTLSVEDLRVAIVGLNTAWLSEGGSSDHGKLLTGERQVIDALRIAGETQPHLIIAMGHHPFHLLNDFDRRAVQRRIQESCQFFHCGHLHEAEAHHTAVASAHCLTVAAGASFETRHSQNAYSLVCLDLMRAARTVRTIQYKPTDGRFSYESEERFPLAINGVPQYSLKDLGHAIETYNSSLAPVAYYMAALLLEVQGDVPISLGATFAFGSLELLANQPNDALKSATEKFAALRNPLKIFGAGMSPAEILVRYGQAVTAYADALEGLCGIHPGLREKLAEREANARALGGVDAPQPFGHTLSLLRELAQEKEWDALRQQAERHLDSAEKPIAIEAMRMLALCLAHAEIGADKHRAAKLYGELVDQEAAQPADVAALATLLLDSGDHTGAKKYVLIGIERFPAATDGFVAIGQSIIEASGDRAFRDELNARRMRRTA